MSIYGYNLLKDGSITDTMKGHYKRRTLNRWRKKGFIIKKIYYNQQTKGSERSTNKDKI